LFDATISGGDGEVILADGSFGGSLKIGREREKHPAAYDHGPKLP